MEIRKPETRLARVWRGVGGVVTAGVVLLALAVGAVQVYAGVHDLPGPGLSSVLCHVLAAVVAVVAQVLADRRTGRVVPWCTVVVLVSAALVLWFFWYA
ncbi:hypothetical protein GCM10022243_40510 [Saccharothrix violaceirubra]